MSEQQATFCASLVDEWVRAGVTDAVVAPGSRSSPLALALASDARLRVHVHPDERAAGFIALGLALASGRPAIVLTTSGTAAAELHPAVVEAHQAGVPLLVCTADRPPELQDLGAPQTIDQTHLYGRAVRWAITAAAGDGRASWRSTASRAVAEARGAASGGWPGPVHLNLPFRDPLVGAPADLPRGRAGGRPWHAAPPGTDVDEATVRALAGELSGRRGLLVAGGGAGDPAAVHELANRLRWPVLADPRSGSYLPESGTVAHWDAVLRVDTFLAAHRPDVVVRLGAPPASKVLAQWLACLPGPQAQVGRVWTDPERTAGWLVTADPTAFCGRFAAAVAEHDDSGWRAEWTAAGERAADAIAKVLAADEDCSEPRTARDVVAALPDGSTLVVASSMPIRDVEWYAVPRTGLRVLSNRGANGIDGVVSTAVGAALAGPGSTAALVGDIAFLHDTNALLGARDRGVDLVVVVVDNDGGGIFSFLPAAAEVPPATFERLFGTPHGVRVEEIAAAHGIASLAVVDPEALTVAVHSAIQTRGVWLVVVRTDRSRNVRVHDDLHAAVADAVRGG